MRAYICFLLHDFCRAAEEFSRHSYAAFERAYNASGIFHGVRFSCPKNYFRGNSSFVTIVPYSCINDNYIIICVRLCNFITFSYFVTVGFCYYVFPFLF